MFGVGLRGFSGEVVVAMLLRDALQDKTLQAKAPKAFSPKFQIPKDPKDPS